MDRISILKTRGGLRMTKTITPAKIRGYDNAKWFSYAPYDVADIHGLHDLLEGLAGHSDMVMIRGELLPDVDPEGNVLRRKDEYGGERIYFREKEAGNHWMMADFDKLPHPEWLEPCDRLEYLVALLPEEFHDVSYHYQWSSSSGLPKAAKDGEPAMPAWATLSAHLFFMMEKPLTDTELCRWADDQEIDAAPMRTVQPNYTAAPIFIEVADPFAGGGRSGLVVKARDTVPPFAVPDEEIVVRHERQRRESGPLGLGKIPDGLDWKEAYRWHHTLLAHLNDIGVRLHMPINRAIACAVKLYGDALDWDALKQSIAARVMLSPHGDKATYLDEHYLEASLRGALLKFPQEKPASAFKSRQDWRRRKDVENRKLTNA